MGGKVFISCGMRLPEEKDAALRVKALLNNKPFNLTPYLAITIQSLDDIMTIIKELRSSYYYLFMTLDENLCLLINNSRSHITWRLAVTLLRYGSEARVIRLVAFSVTCLAIPSGLVPRKN